MFSEKELEAFAAATRDKEINEFPREFKRNKWIDVLLNENGKVYKGYEHPKEIVPRERVFEVIASVYKDPKTGFKGVHALFGEISKYYHGITRNDVAAWLARHPTHTLHRVQEEEKSKKPVVVRGPWLYWQADLVDYSRTKTFNFGEAFLLTVVDIFSKFAWVVPLANKQPETMKAAFDGIFKSIGGKKPKTIQTDSGSEFKNAVVSGYFDNLDIHQSFSRPYSPQSNGHIERFNRTLKTRLELYMKEIAEEREDGRWLRFVNVLDDVVANYNRTKHSSTGYAPLVLSRTRDPDTLAAVHSKLLRAGNKRVVESKESFHLAPLEVGDEVRLRLLRKPLEKSYKQRWTRDIYVVREVYKGQIGNDGSDGYKPKLETHDRYVIETKQGEGVKGTFYRGDLLKVFSPDSDELDVEIEVGAQPDIVDDPDEVPPLED